MITPNMLISDDEMYKFLMGFSYKEPQVPPPSRKNKSEKGKSMLDSFREWQENREPSDEEIKDFSLEQFNSILGEFNIQVFKELISLSMRIQELENREEEEQDGTD